MPTGPGNELNMSGEFILGKDPFAPQPSDAPNTSRVTEVWLRDDAGTYLARTACFTSYGLMLQDFHLMKGDDEVARGVGPDEEVTLPYVDIDEILGEMPGTGCEPYMPGAYE